MEDPGALAAPRPLSTAPARAAEMGRLGRERFRGSSTPACTCAGSRRPTAERAPTAARPWRWRTRVAGERGAGAAPGLSRRRQRPQRQHGHHHGPRSPPGVLAAGGCATCGSAAYTTTPGGVRASVRRCPVWTAVMKRVRDEGAAVDEPGIGQRPRPAAHPRPLILARRPAAAPRSPSTPTTATSPVSTARSPTRPVPRSSSTAPSSRPTACCSQLPGVEVSVLHVVRDPRATAWSWQRHKDSRDGSGLRHRHESGRAPAEAGLEPPRGLPVAHRSPWVPGPYEDSPARRELPSPVARMLGATAEDLPFVTEDTVRLAPTHSVAGNPNRHNTGVVLVRPDDEWATAMPLRDRPWCRRSPRQGWPRWATPHAHTAHPAHPRTRPDGSSPLT